MTVKKTQKNLKRMEKRIDKKSINFTTFCNYYKNYLEGIKNQTIDTPLKDGLYLYNADVSHLNSVDAKKVSIMKEDLKSLLLIISTSEVLTNYYNIVCQKLIKSKTIPLEKYLKYINFLIFVIEENFENIDPYILFSILTSIHLDYPKNELERSIRNKGKNILYNLSYTIYPKEESERIKPNVQVLSRQ